MAETSTTESTGPRDEAVDARPEAPEPYRESDDHVPSSTDITSQLDTTATGGPNDIRQVAPAFDRAAALDVVEASDALKNDDPVVLTRVVLPDDKDDRQPAIDRLHAKAEEHREAGVVGAAETQQVALSQGAGLAGGDSAVTPAATGPGDAGAPSSLVSNAPSSRADLAAAGQDRQEPGTTTDQAARAGSLPGGLDDVDASFNTAGTGVAVGTGTAGANGTSDRGTVGRTAAEDPNVKPAGSGSSTGTTSGTAAPSVSTSQYDPSKYGVAEVQKHLDEHPDEADAVKKAEYEGVEGGGQPKKRSSIRDYTPKA